MYTVKLYWTQHNHYNPDRILEQSLRRCVALHVSLRMPSVYKDQVDCMYGFSCLSKYNSFIQLNVMHLHNYLNQPNWYFDQSSTCGSRKPCSDYLNSTIYTIIKKLASRTKMNVIDYLLMNYKFHSHCKIRKQQYITDSRILLRLSV